MKYIGKTLLFPLNLDLKMNLVNFENLINDIGMVIVLILLRKKNGGSPLKYYKGVILNFENLSNYRMFDLKCSKKIE